MFWPVQCGFDGFFYIEHFLIGLCGMWVFQGRQEGVNIDPWEDADYNIYKVTDRFGFLQ